MGQPGRNAGVAEWRHTHQVLFTQSPELLELLRYQELSTSDCAANFPQHCRDGEIRKRKDSVQLTWFCSVLGWRLWISKASLCWGKKLITAGTAGQQTNRCWPRGLLLNTLQRMAWRRLRCTEQCDPLYRNLSLYGSCSCPFVTFQHLLKWPTKILHRWQTVGDQKFAHTGRFSAARMWAWPARMCTRANRRMSQPDVEPLIWRFNQFQTDLCNSGDYECACER